MIHLGACRKEKSEMQGWAEGENANEMFAVLEGDRAGLALLHRGTLLAQERHWRAREWHRLKTEFVGGKHGISKKY